MFPFGADEEDYEFNYILDRNLEIGMLIVDDLHNQVPPVYVESLNDEVKLLHTVGSAAFANHPQRQHLRKYRFQEAQMMKVEGDIGVNVLDKGEASKLSFTDFDYMANGPRGRLHSMR